MFQSEKLVLNNIIRNAEWRIIDIRITYVFEFDTEPNYKDSYRTIVFHDFTLKSLLIVTKK